MDSMANRRVVPVVQGPYTSSAEYQQKYSQSVIPKFWLQSSPFVYFQNKLFSNDLLNRGLCTKGYEAEEDMMNAFAEDPHSNKIGVRRKLLMPTSSPL